MSDIYYHTKYIKYKSKYFKLKNNMHGGADVPFYGTRAPIPDVKCTSEANPYKNAASGDPSGAWIRELKGTPGYPLNNCPDPSENYFCAQVGENQDVSCVPKCFSSADCDVNEDCSENRCIPKRTDLVIPPIKTEMTPEEKLDSMRYAFLKSEKDAMNKEYEEERKRAEKEKNKELLIAFNETMETGTRRRGIKTRERQELEDDISNKVAALKRNQDKEKRDLNKTYRQALNAKDNLKKNYLLKVMEDLADIHREERDRLKSQSLKRRNFLKEKQANINDRNQSLEEMKKDFDDKIAKVQDSSTAANKLSREALEALNDAYSAALRSGAEEEELQRKKQEVKDKKEAMKKEKENKKMNYLL